MTVTGNLPLTLPNAVQKNIHSLTQYGLCVQDGTPTPDAPMDILCNNGALKWNGTAVVADGTPEVLTVNGAQMLDPSTVPDENKFILSQGGGTQAPSPTGGVFRHSAYIPVKEGTKYFFGMTPYAATSAGIAWYSTTEPTSFLSGLNGSALKNSYNMKATAPAGARYLRFGWRIDAGYDTDWEHSVYVCEYDSNSAPIMTVWQAYAAPQNASVPMLLGVGGIYRDDVELISGIKTGKVGVKVLDGTETGWTEADTSGVVRFYLTFDRAETTTSARTQITSTHFAYAAGGQGLGTTFLSVQRRVFFVPSDQTMTVTTWKAWLADQYAAGTPVIVLYPLATATTEQTTPQHLHTTSGTNVVEASANVEPIAAKVEYYAMPT